jgi:hypothetical protein
MSLLLGKRLEGLVELLVLLATLLLLELHDFLLLLEQPSLNLLHVVVCLDHLCEEVVWSFDGAVGLNTDSHGFLNVLTGDVVECNFPLDIVIDVELLSSLCEMDSLWVGHGHVLQKWNLSLLLDQLCRFESIVEALFNLI